MARLSSFLKFPAKGVIAVLACALVSTTARAAEPSKGYKALAAEWANASTFTPSGLPPNPNGLKQPATVVLACASSGSNLFCDRQVLTPKPDGSLKIDLTEGFATKFYYHYDEYSSHFESFGLINISSEVRCADCQKTETRLSDLVLTGVPPVRWSADRFKLQLRVLRSESNGREYSGWDLSCTYQPVDASHVQTECMGKRHSETPWAIVEDRNVGSTKRYFFFQPLGIYLVVGPSHEFDGGEVIIEDYRFANQPWQSQQRSAALTPEQRDKARAFFRQAFDLFKSGDFNGAKALVEAGLKIDPGNATALFTLAEIHRSKSAGEGPNEGRFLDLACARASYQRVVDLDPDSPNAVLAAGYLKDGN